MYQKHLNGLHYLSVYRPCLYKYKIITRNKILKIMSIVFIL